MGRHALIMIVTLVILLSYFVIHTNNAKIAASSQNYDDYSYKQAKNISNSAAQMIARNIMRPDISGWPDFRFNTYNNLLNEHVSDFTDWRDWTSLGGQYRIESLFKSGTDLILIVAGSEDYISNHQQTRLVLKENQTMIPYWDYAVYARQTILMNNPNPYIDSYNTNSPDSLWSFMGEFANAKVGTDLAYVDDDYPINRIDQIYGPDPDYSTNKYTPDIVMPTGGTPIVIANNNATITDGVYSTGGFSLSGNRVLTIDGDVTLYITGNISTGGNSTIAVTPNSSLIIYLDGNLDIGGTGFVNSSEIPANLQIFGTPNCTSIALRGNSDTHAAIYAPQADTKLLGTTHFYGAVVCDEMELVGTIAFHYDEALGGDPELTYNSIFKYYIASWE